MAGDNAGNTVVTLESPQPNTLIRAIWFVLVGWWLSGLATLLATLLQLTIVGIPAAVYIINRIPQITTLKSSRTVEVAEGEAGFVRVGFSDREQRSWWIRAIYYVLVGWWAVSLWLSVAWIAGLTIILLPLSFWMYGAAGKIQTLRR
ncbi:MAG: YccF domain-containing protein [Dehalococcoidia bacterium]|nr:YccF domain-containing protein [Dehalococcoidia bacterium]MYA53896.1 YccF domain-containing protein [Dehalococcoidia bacterium]